MSSGNYGHAPHPTSAQAERERVFFVALPPQQLLDELTIFMTQRDYALESRIESSVTLTRYEGPNLALGCILLLLFILPGILYLILAGHDVRTTVMAMEAEGGCRFIIGGDDLSGRYMIYEWAETLPKPQTT